MAIPLRVLFIEDSDNDIQLFVGELSRGGFDPEYERVDTPDAINAALDTKSWDMIIADYSAPQFSGLAALALVKERGDDIPLILVSGTVGEDVAVEALKEGASDYLLKNNLIRFVPAVQRALRETEQDRARKRAEERLRESEEKFRSFVETTNEWIWSIDETGRFTYSNPACELLLGYSPEEIMTIEPHLLLHEEDFQEFAATFPEYVARKRGWSNWVLRWRHKDGSFRYLECNANPIVNAKGDLVGFQGTDRDITPRMNAEKEIRNQKEFLTQVIDTSPNLIFVRDMDGKFTLANKAVAKVYDTTAENLIGKTVADFHLDKEEVEHFLKDDSEVIATKQPKFIAEEKVTTAAGEERWFQTTKVPLFLSNGDVPHVLGVASDITESRKLEQQLLQSQKMEAIGRLAGGVAHDFNNLLTVIIGYSELLLYQLQPNDPMRLSLQDIHKAAERAASLTSQLLAFGRKQIFQTKIIDLNSLITNLEKMLGRLLGEDIEIKLTQSPDLKKIEADPSKIEQVVINLAINARDAMPEGGKLIITTANVELDEQYAREHLEVNPGPYVMLAINDTGHGMDEETLEHIFEPFFTTKETGKGTGLGLATVYGIVKQSGGHIWVYSEPDHGTMFKLYFPQVVEVDESQLKTLELEQSPSGTETVLLAEDEDLVRNLATRVLREKGYTVIRASDGEEALQIANTYKGKIDLLLTDVVMPRISGRVLANKIGLARPDIKILFISGYTDDAIAHHGILEPGTAFLEKPFTPLSLALKVREILDSPANQNNKSV